MLGLMNSVAVDQARPAYRIRRISGATALTPAGSSRIFPHRGMGTVEGPRVFVERGVGEAQSLPSRYDMPPLPPTSIPKLAVREFVLRAPLENCSVFDDWRTSDKRTQRLDSLRLASKRLFVEWPIYGQLGAAIDGCVVIVGSMAVR